MKTTYSMRATALALALMIPACEGGGVQKTTTGGAGGNGAGRGGDGGVSVSDGSSLIPLADAADPERTAELLERALTLGPRSLGAQEKMEILRNPRLMEELHRRVWEITDRDRALLWGLECPCLE